MSRFTPIMLYDRERNEIHCVTPAVSSADFPLCGANNDPAKPMTRKHGARISCPDCDKIIRYCRGMSARALPGRMPQPRGRKRKYADELRDQKRA